MKRLIVCTLILFGVQSTAFAKSSSSGSSPGGGGGSGGFSMGFGIVAETDITGGVGAITNADKTIPNCSMLFGEGLVTLGLRLGPIAPVAQAAYRYVGQVTDPSTVNNVNMAGSGYLGGAGLKLFLHRVSSSLIYDFTGNYKLNAQTTNSEDVSYSGVMGLHLVVAYHLTPTFDAILNASYVTYKTKTVAGIDEDISSNLMNQQFYGFGLGFRF